MNIQSKTDTRIRTILLESSEDAAKTVSALEKNSTFSAGVRTAQIRLVMKEIKDILSGVFDEITPVIRNGQKQEAEAAIDGLTETDRDYLESALQNSVSVSDFVDSQKLQAKIQVINAINRVTKSDRPLSARVYRTQALAQRWVQRDVTTGIARGSSAKEIAAIVRKHIRPNTPGGVSYAALRLGRTELNNAFHSTAITFAQDRPWIQGMEWFLSSVHEFDPQRVEVCETYSGQIFPVTNVPSKPHPQCRCFVAPVLESSDVFIRNLTAGQYRDWINNAA
jgi:hypothetical protein